MIPHNKLIKIFTGNANPTLAQAICDCLGLKLGESEIGTFNDGEIFASFFETVRGADVFLCNSTCTPVNNNLMELLIMIDACKRASAQRITAVVPYFGYARQDRKNKPRDPISGKLVADLITAAGADRVLTLDLHCSQLQGFFDIPVDNLVGSPIFVKHFSDKFEDEHDNIVVVSPDIGSVQRARYFAERMSLPLAIVDKRRVKAGHSEVMNIIGDVRDKKVILYDDMVDTAGSMVNAAKTLVENGATEVYACASHAVMSGAAVQNIENSPIKELAVLDTIAPPNLTKLKVLSVAPIFAEAIERIYEEISISDLFK
ncbi:MAG: ribose-phosphate pyrophosphokinase [Oscillospiraceae bacterium]|nr:ribose-phosphate pyrophosphokinase [Oscillospiraceae bacterium]